MSAAVVASTTFIDLSTYSEIEGHMYGGPDAVTIFVRAVQKANWHSIIPISLRLSSTPDFGAQKGAALLNRSGDYVLSVWFRAQIPKLQFPVGTKVDASMRWTNNLMHNLFSRIWITFNELTIQEFDNYWLDFNYQFRLRGSKRVGYRNMIGDISALTTEVTFGGSNVLGNDGIFQCPFPFWFGEDTGNALPVAALPNNEVRVNYDINKVTDLLIVRPGVNPAGIAGSQTTIVNMTGGKPSLGQPEVYAHYAVVHNDERVAMGDAPRDMLLHQVQMVQVSPFKDVSTLTSFDIRLSHSIVAMFFAAQNKTVQTLGLGGEWSNYTTLTCLANADGADPISTATLRYEASPRFSMGADYFSMTAPYYFSDAIPDDTGYHMYSYSPDAWNLDPLGSTNYSKLANVSIEYNMSSAAINAANGLLADGAAITYSAVPVGGSVKQSFQHVFQAKNWSIGRIANGSLAYTSI